MNSPNNSLYVSIDRNGETTLVGQAWFTHRRGETSTVFAYSPSYLSGNAPFQIDPQLPLVSGNQYVDSLPGSFADCAPDRWGRLLIQRNRRRNAEANERQRDLTEVDFLTGVSDRTRQGVLRFSVSPDGDFLDPHDHVPKLISLPKLLAASNKVAETSGSAGSSSASEDFSAVSTLLEAGSASLGGARPKASVLDTQKRLSIAKFPHRNDDWNVMAWEATALDIAEAAGCDTPDRELINIDGHSVLLLRRFDRDTRNTTAIRLGYMSAMTLLSATDGDEADYLDIAEAISDISTRADTDLAELYRRTAVNVTINNVDDHLRNHGFLANGGGWRLSPVFDINPDLNVNAARVTSIAGCVLKQEAASALAELARACRLSSTKRKEIDENVKAATRDWQKHANRNGVSAAEQRRFAHLFD